MIGLVKYKTGENPQIKSLETTLPMQRVETQRHYGYEAV